MRYLSLGNASVYLPLDFYVWDYSRCKNSRTGVLLYFWLFWFFGENQNFGLCQGCWPTQSGIWNSLWICCCLVGKVRFPRLRCRLCCPKHFLWCICSYFDSQVWVTASDLWMWFWRENVNHKIFCFLSLVVLCCSMLFSLGVWVSSDVTKVSKMVTEWGVRIFVWSIFFFQ